METVALSPQERTHIEQGGCLLVVEEIAGPRWRVLAISSQGQEVLPAGPAMPAHDLHRDALRMACAAARAWGPQAMTRPSRYSYEVDFHVAGLGVAWRLRMQKDSRDVEEKLFHLPDDAEDDEEAFYDAHDRALYAGERWVASSLDG